MELYCLQKSYRLAMVRSVAATCNFVMTVKEYPTMEELLLNCNVPAIYKEQVPILKVDDDGTYFCGVPAICNYIATCANPHYFKGKKNMRGEDITPIAGLKKDHSELIGHGRCDDVSRINNIIHIISYSLLEACESKSKDRFDTILKSFDEYLIDNTYLGSHTVSACDIVFITMMDEAIKSSFITVDDLNKYKSVHRLYNCVYENDMFLLAKRANSTNVACKMDLDAFKREYSNTKKLRDIAMPYLIKHFDHESCSIYYMKYDKLEDELKVGFVSSNQLDGFLQRIDNNFRKRAFGSLCVIGSEGDYEIRGVWLFTEPGIPTDLSAHPSFEYHEFRRLNINDATDKELMFQYFCDDIVEGIPVYDKTVFK